MTTNPKPPSPRGPQVLAGPAALDEAAGTYHAEVDVPADAKLGPYTVQLMVSSRRSRGGACLSAVLVRSVMPLEIMCAA